MLWASFVLAYAASRLAYDLLWLRTWWYPARWSLFALMLVLTAWAAVEHRHYRWAVMLVATGGTLLAHRELLLNSLARIIWRWRGFAP